MNDSARCSYLLGSYNQRRPWKTLYRGEEIYDLRAVYFLSNVNGRKYMTWKFSYISLVAMLFGRREIISGWSILPTVSTNTFSTSSILKKRKNDKNYIIPLNNSDNIKLSYINFNFFLEFPYTKCILCMVISNVVYYTEMADRPSRQMCM